MTHLLTTPWSEQTTLVSTRNIRARMECELSGRDASSPPACILCVQIESLHLIEGMYGEAVSRRLLDDAMNVVERRCRAAAPLGLVDQGQLLIMLRRTTLADALRFAGQLLRDIERIDVRVPKTRLSIAASIGVAHTAHARSYAFATLVEVAREGCQVASAAGASQFIHTELYELIEPNAPQVRVASDAKRRPGSSIEQPAKQNNVREAPPENPDPVVDRDGFETVVPAGPCSSETAPVPIATRPRETKPSPQRSPARVEGREGVLVQMLDEAFASYDAGGNNLRQLEEQVMQSVQRWLQEQHGVPANTQALTREVDTLRRRLRKLTSSLEETERELARVQALEPVEEGVASQFRTVQGLSSKDAQFELKRELMSKILEANLALREPAPAEIDPS